MTTNQKEKESINVRLLIVEVLLEINEKGAYSHMVLKDVLDKHGYLPKRDRSFLTRVVEGTLEHQIRLDYMIDCFSKVPVRKQKPVIREILRSGVYQLLYMDSVPASAVCNEAVKLAGKKGFQGLKGFVNGVLRSIARGADTVKYPSMEKEPVKALSVKYSMPEWILEKWLATYEPNVVTQMLSSFVQEEEKKAGISLRCQLTNGSVEECIRMLEEEQVTVSLSPYLPYALCIENFDRLDGLSAFREGKCTVQDVSSMLVGEIADPQPGQVVLDVCAAPGGKSLHVADRLKGTGMVYARDVSQYKAERILDNQQRLGVTNMEVQVWNACALDEGSVEMADLVLADVPCSGLGVMGKKKDIKYRMTAEGQQELVKLQREILDTVWQYVKPGGVLIYSTCTIHAEENENNVRWFVEEYPFEIESVEPYLCPELKGAVDEENGYLQLLPGIHQTDGFFIARLRRQLEG